MNDGVKIHDKYDPAEIFSYFLYQIHNCRRLEHLATLGLDLHRRSVLDVGAGVGDLTSFFINRDCPVTALEGRPDSAAILRKRLPTVKVIEADIEAAAGPPLDPHDVVFCYGLFYHLAEPALALGRCAAATKRMMLIETCVTMNPKPVLSAGTEDQAHPSAGLTGTAQIPSRAWLVEELKKHFPHVYLPRTQPNHPEFPLDWSRPPERPQTRAIFIASHAPLRNAQLVDSIPERQTRCA